MAYLLLNIIIFSRYFTEIVSQKLLKGESVMKLKPRCHFGCYSDKGLKAENQDSMGFVLPDEDNILQNKGISLAIADGVSGSDAGKEASACTIQSMMADYYCTADSWTVQTSVQKVLVALNRWMYAQARAVGRSRTMATTLSAAIFKSTTAHIFHIGDSRIYLLRDGQLQQLTQDHIWETPQTRQLTRAVGIDLNIDIDYRKLALQANDYFIFTTDGVHSYVSEKQIISTVHQASDLNLAAQQLSDIALKQGSPDNVSCQIIQFETLPSQDVQELYQQLTAVPFPPELQIGTKLDYYRVIRELHRSKRGKIYQAVDESTGELVVLKIPSVKYQDDPIYLDLFTHEEWVGKRLKHPNIVKLFAPQRPKNFLYGVTDYIDGQSLRAWMRNSGVLPLEEVRNAAKQIALGLQAMHRLEMVHQDIKPENVMRDKEGCLKLIDFSSTRISGIEEISSPLGQHPLLGTKYYSAPEYFLGQKGTQRADIFSLGVIVYEMLTGKLPYDEKHADEKMTNAVYIPLRHWQPEIALWVDKAVEKAVHVNPDYRYDEVMEFIHDLSHPNASLVRSTQLPLMKRNPVAFWRGLSLFLLLTNVITLINF